MIYITGDIHGEYQRLENKKLKHLKENDCLIICGDFGFLWDATEKERHMLNKLREKKYRILFVDGTHENFSLLSAYPITSLYGGTVRKLGNNLFQLLRGEVYTIEGKTFFAFGGGSSSDKELRIANGKWWPEEMASTEEMQRGTDNLEKYNRKVDYIITHEPSLRDMSLASGVSRIDPINTYFDELTRYIDYKQWFFGSLHMDKKLSHTRAQCLFMDIVKIK